MRRIAPALILATALVWSFMLQAAEITLSAPADKATVALLNEKQKGYIAMPRAERIKAFADKATRKDLVKKAGWLPLPVEFKWNWDGAADTAFTVKVAEDASFANCVTIDAKENSAKLDNLKMNKEYFWKVTASVDGKQCESKTYTFKTEDIAPRLMRFSNVPNCRDLGGRKAMNGKRVKQNMVFRTAGMNWNAKAVTEENKDVLFKKLPALKEKYERALAELEFIKKEAEKAKNAKIVPYSLSSKWYAFRPAAKSLGADDIAAIEKLTGVPEEFMGAKREDAQLAKNGRFSFPGHDDGRLALFMQEFESPDEGIMQISAGADWFWELRLNGVKVFNKMGGNEKSPSTSNYRINLPVKKGKNILAVTLLSGLDSWMWCCGKRDFIPVDKVFAEQIEGREREIKYILKTPVDRRPGANRLTEDAKTYMKGTLGIKSDIDLRSDGECYGMTGSPLGAPVAWLHISSSAYAGMKGDRGKKAFIEVFKVFLDEKNYPLVFHCIAGQDRTGAVAFIINGLLGVEEEELYLDWEFSGLWNPDMTFNHEKRFNHLVEVFTPLEGKNINEKVETYVLSLGFTKADIEKLRSIMLE